jgi:hypothetical protein
MAASPTLTVRKLLSITPELAIAIADYRFQHRIATESEATRRLIEIGLATAAKAQPSKQPGKQSAN